MAKNDELKQPDVFISTTARVWDRIAENSKQIGIGLAVVLLAAVVVLGIDEHQQNVRAEAGADLAKALHLAQRPVKGEDADDDEKPDTPPAPDDAPFKTDAEKQAALAAALKDVIAKHPGTDGARSALVPLGDAQLKLGQLDDAQRSYSDFVSQAGDDTAMRALAELGLAKVAEAKKDWNGAQAAYENLQRDAPHTFLKDRAALGKARVMELNGKKQDAAVAYQDVKEGFTGTDASREATERLALLATEGIKPPARAAPVGGSTDSGMPFAPKAE